MLAEPGPFYRVSLGMDTRKLVCERIMLESGSDRAKGSRRPLTPGSFQIKTFGS